MARVKKTIITETPIVNTSEQVVEPILDVQNTTVNITEKVNTEQPIEFNNVSQNIVVENVQSVIDQDAVNRERLRRRLLGYC
jgi:hypothetical protein